MEIVFSSSPIEDVVNYVLSRFPYSPLGLIGEDGELLLALEKQGNKVYPYDGGFDERARLILAVGGSKEVDVAKKEGLPYIVLSRGVPISAIQKIGVYDYQILEYGYPNILFIDERENTLSLQAELSSLALSVMAEAIGIVGTGLKNERALRAAEAVAEIRSALSAFTTNARLAELLADVLKRIDGAPFWALLDRLNEERCLDNALHARFYSAFSLLYSIRRFTNIDFCVILPYMDLVRARMLADGMGISLNEGRPLPKDMRYPLSLVRDLLPEEKELCSYLDRFRLEAGEVRVDLGIILSDFVLCAVLCPKPSLLVDLVRSGYIDALIDG